jgi:molybdopterin-binding protein
VIELAGLSARVGRFALRDVTFSVPRGGWGVVLGPAGAGKTTLLEAVAGVVDATGGSVRLGGRDVTRAPIEHRGAGLVYQHAYLFPHLGVAENVRYGTRDPDAARAVSDLLGATALNGRAVGSLSGGERQIVALARTLARRPPVLLLDEPFSALDPRRRSAVRRAVRGLVRDWGTTVLQVTHDFEEAGLLGDVAIVLDDGRVQQVAPPSQLFRAPATSAVADFLGMENVFEGVVAGDGPADAAGVRPVRFTGQGLVLHAVGDAADGRGHAVIRAGEIVLSRAAAEGSARNTFSGDVIELVGTGALVRATVHVGEAAFVVALTAQSAQAMELAAGATVHLSFKATAVHLC